MLPTPSPFPGWKVLRLSCRGRPESLPLPVASNRFFSCRESFVSPDHCKWEDPRPPRPVLWKGSLIQSNFLDVIGDRWIHEAPQRLAGSRGLANRRRGNRLVDLVQQMDG